MISEPPQHFHHFNPVRFWLEAKLVVYPHIEIELYLKVLETRVAHFRILVGIAEMHWVQRYKKFSVFANL